MPRRRTALAVLAIVGSLACGRQPRPTVAQLNVLDPVGVTYATPRAKLPPAPILPATLRVLVTGDFGEVSAQRAEVIAGMARAHRERPFDLALFLGDNVYQCGPDVRAPGAEACRFAADGNRVEPGFVPPADPSFETAHDHPVREALASSTGASSPPVYLVLGNHDVKTDGGCGEPGLAPEALSRLRACLSVAHRAPTYAMPARHFTFDAGPVRFIAIDGNLLEGDYGGFRFEDELSFVRGAAEGCAARPCFLLSHQPPATGGPARRGRGPAYAARVEAVEEAAGGRLAAWLSGHHHDLQHLRTPMGRDAFVSGATSTSRDLPLEAVSPPGAALLFFTSRWGFAVLEAGEEPAPWWGMRFEDAGGRPLHCCVARGGPCEPVACAPGSAR